MNNAQQNVAPEVASVALEQSALEARKVVRDKILKYVGRHTVIIWGSGATMDLGFPSMKDLLDIMSKEPDFGALRDMIGNGFEERLTNFFNYKCPEAREVFQDRACKIIGKEFTKRENAPMCRDKEKYYEAMFDLYSFLLDSKKGSVDILTTNYDCAWERLFQQRGVEFLDGFQKNELDYSAFFNEDYSSVRLVKVHGSDNWFRYDTKDQYVEKVDIGHTPQDNAQLKSHKIIIPTNMKYEDAVKDTSFANLMLAFGRIIKEADSYLTIGFGFNDSHLTPLLKQEARKGKPVVRLMKDITNGGRDFANGIPNIITLSDAGSDSIPNSPQIVFDVLQKAFQSEFDKARQRLLHYKYLPEAVKGIVWLDQFAKELANKNFCNVIEVVRQWKEQIERERVKATSVCWQGKGNSDSTYVPDYDLWRLPSFIKLLTEKKKLGGKP